MQPENTPRKRRGRPILSEHDLGPIDRRPWGTHGHGTIMRSIRMTPLGWAHVSPAVLKRLGVTLGEVRT